MKRGRFITIEGGEGAGKSTQAARLAANLERRGMPTLVTREPGGAAGAERIRALLLDPGGAGWEPAAEVLLHFAARAENVAKTVKPALAAGRIVISDRFADSTLAYQGYGSGAPPAAIRAIGEAALDGFRPDLTLILDVDPAVGLARARKRAASADRYENEPLDFHWRVRKGFMDIAAAEPERCAAINSAQDEDRVAGEILSTVLRRLDEPAG